MSAAAEQHLALIRRMPCAICSCAAEAHHAIGRGVSMRLGTGVRGRAKNSDFLTLPLCQLHHTGPHGIHVLGVATFENRYGTTQEAIIDDIGRRLGLNLWQLARDEIEQTRTNRKYKPPAKQGKPDIDKEPLALGRMKFGGKIRSAGFAKVEKTRTSLSSSKIVPRS